MKIWSKELDDKFLKITTGSNDITGASQLQNVSNYLKSKNIDLRNESIKKCAWCILIH